MAGIELTLRPGLPFDYVVTVTDTGGTPLDISGSEITLKMRRALQDSVVIAEISTANGGITIGTDPGAFRIFLSAQDTLTIQGNLVFDILLKTADDVYYLIAEDSKIKTKLFVSRA